VLFLTAYDDPKVRERALAGPCLGYFRKTDSGSEILEAIRHGVLPFEMRTQSFSFTVVRRRPIGKPQS